MKSPFFITLISFLAVFWGSFFGFTTKNTLLAVPRNPPPVFETEYSLPTTATPPSAYPLAAENFVAAALYAVLLLFAGIAAYHWRSRKILFALAVVSVAVFGFLLDGCPCPVGMTQNLVDAFVQPLPFIPWTVIILFSLPLLVALFFGRVFCSSVCPFGAVQELTVLKNIKIPEGLEHVLGVFRFIYLGLGVFSVFTGLGYLICRFDPYVGFFRFSGLFPIMVFSSGILVLGFFIGRPFCRFLCPYGALLGVCALLSAKKIRVTPKDCTQCRLCEDICPYNAILKPTATPTAAERKKGLRHFILTLLTLPLFVILFAVIGYYTAPRFAVRHYEVRQAELLYAEEQKLTDSFGSFPETRAMFQRGDSNNDVYRRAWERYALFRQGGLWLGTWIGAVIGLKFITLTLRRKRTEYEADASRCFVCGRCFWYCPNQKVERILLNGVKQAAAEPLV